MAKNYSGRDYLIYLATAAPTDAAITTDYSLVGLTRNLSISESRNALDKSNKADGDNSTFVAGRRNVTISGSAIWDHTSDTGQAVLRTAFDAADGTIYFLITTGTVSEQEFHGSGILTTNNKSFNDEDLSTVDFTIQVSGSFTEVSADSTT